VGRELEQEAADRHATVTQPKQKKKNEYITSNIDHTVFRGNETEKRPTTETREYKIRGLKGQKVTPVLD